MARWEESVDMEAEQSKYRAIKKFYMARSNVKDSTTIIEFCTKIPHFLKLIFTLNGSAHDIQK